MTIKERIDHWKSAERDSNYRHDLLNICKHGPDADVWFFNLFLCTFDPRLDARGKPLGELEFLLWPRQEELARFIGNCIDTEHDGAVEKSRDGGATWVVEGAAFRRWLLVPGFSALISTITEDLIYKTDDPDSLFFKLAFFTRTLPPWFIRATIPDWNEDKHLGYMKLVNPTNKNVISGMAPTAKFGRSGRRTMAMLDEWAFWFYGREAFKACSGTTRCRIVLSTPNGNEGESNHFCQLVRGTGDYENVRIKKFRLHWTHDPRKSAVETDPETGEEYFTFKRAMIGDIKRGIPGRMSEQEFSEEYDIEYERSTKGRIYAEQLPYANIGHYPYDPSFELCTDWDFGVGDACFIAWWQFDLDTYRYRFIQSYRNNGFGIGFYIPLVTGRVKDETERLEHEADYTEEDLKLISIATSRQQMVRTKDGLRRIVPYAHHFADPNARARGASDGRSAKQLLQDAGIYLTFNDKNAGKGYSGRIEESRRVLRYSDIDEVNCQDLILSLKDYKWNKQLTEPEHNDASHGASAYQMGCVSDPYMQVWMNRVKALQKGKLMIPGGVFGNIDLIVKDLKNEREDERKQARSYQQRRRGHAGY